MAKLIIRRTSEWNNRMRSFGIYLNDQKIGTIRNGEIKEFEVEPGIHELKAKIDWCESETIKVEVKADKAKALELTGFKYGKYMMPISLVLCIVYFAFRETLKINSGLFLAILSPVLLYLVYIMSFSRKKYLRIYEIYNFFI